MVLSVEAKKQTDGSWEVYTDCARESTGINVIDWVQEAEMLGAGEILLTSIDQEGTAKGYDAELIETVSNIVKVPIIASGGYGKPEDIHKAVAAGADALAFADILHIKNSNFSELRKIALSYDIDIRAL
jgi:cyclase